MVEISEQKNRLKITEIFFSLQGEARNVGLPTVFIRLTGCPLRCSYCDTAYAFSGGEWMNVASIINNVKQFKTLHVTVTGGEPLVQKHCFELLKKLCDLGYDVSLETSGAMLLDDVDLRVIKILDVKTPASKEDTKNKFENFSLLNTKDQLKFVICNEDDYFWSKQLVAQHQLDKKCEILFSPSCNQLAETTLADWILRDQLNVRFQFQLHKYLWGDKPGV
ncbi:7-carboxy-7-deazaguanine synthase [hydrothermal vent metagenome]|uniref:7-carboxy-7-deazaguanine synthase n=1 Tax=hydrothermal vent metagenome TaxID=652676 RepID=A0A3B0WPQ9_9ZZZZ